MRQLPEYSQHAAGHQKGAPGGDLFAEIHNAEIDAFAPQSGGQLVGIGDIGDHGCGDHPDGAGEDAAHYMADDQRQGVPCAKRAAAPISTVAISNRVADAMVAMMYRVRFSVRRASDIHRTTPPKAPE